MSVLPQVLRANYADLFGSSALPALEEMFRHNLELHPSIRERLFHMLKTDRDIWQSSEMGDLQNFLEVAEGTDYTFVKPRAGANKTATIKKYGLGFSISEETVEDGKFDFIALCMSALAESAMDTRETSAMNIFNNGFSSSAQTWDGQNLFSTTHVVPSGLTFRNKASTDADLSPSALDAAITDFETQQIRDSGKIARLRAKTLLVPTGMKRYAEEIVGSDKKADSADNNMNSLKNEGLTVVESARLTDSDAWFLIGEPSKTGLKIITRKPIETKAASPDQGFVNDSLMFKARYREIVALTHAYGVWGSSGA